MAIIIGIDPGLANTGFGIIESRSGKNIHIAHGTINTSPGEPLEKRLLKIHQELLEIIEKYQPRQGAVESLFFAKNVKSAIPVAHARGAAMVALAVRDVLTSEYTPLEIKQAVVGNGRASKEQVQQMTRILLGLPEIPSPDHAADALAVAICHHHCYAVNSVLEKM